MSHFTLRGSERILYTRWFCLSNGVARAQGRTQKEVDHVYEFPLVGFAAFALACVVVLWAKASATDGQRHRGDCQRVSEVLPRDQKARRGRSGKGAAARQCLHEAIRVAARLW